MARRVAARLGWLALGTTGTIGTVGVALVAVDPDGTRIPGSDGAPARFLRTTFMATWTGLDYKWHLRGLERGTEEYKDMLHSTNLRAAQRLYKVCNAHGGVYTKLGQYVATMNHVLPQEFVDILAPLTDRAKGMSTSDALKVIEDENAKLSMAKAVSKNSPVVHIDPEPIAAASIAQVHRGRLEDGTEVAVKLQYPWLERQVRSDMNTLSVVSKIIGWLYPSFDYHWVMQEFKGNIQFELNFVQEGINSERVANMFKFDPRIRVPKVIWAATTPRMLTMEFVQGIKVTDKAALKEAGIDASEVARITTQTFSAMIHVHGFVHCDPHPGNLLVTAPSAHGQFQLVVLDHGMYRRLDPSFRQSYCCLWEALLLGNRQAGLDAILKMGIFGDNEVDQQRLSDTFSLLSLVLTYRRPGGATKLGERMSKEERKRLREELKDLEAVDVNNFLESLPRDILFVLRTLSIVRSLNKTLGGTTRQRFTTIGDSAAKGIAVTKADKVTGVAGDYCNTDAKHNIGMPQRKNTTPADVPHRQVALELQGDELASATSFINEIVDSERMVWVCSNQGLKSKITSWLWYELESIQNQLRVRFWVWFMETFTNIEI